MWSLDSSYFSGHVSGYQKEQGGRDSRGEGKRKQQKGHSFSNMSKQRGSLRFLRGRQNSRHLHRPEASVPTWPKMKKCKGVSGCKVARSPTLRGGGSKISSFMPWRIVKGISTYSKCDLTNSKPGVCGAWCNGRKRKPSCRVSFLLVHTTSLDAAVWKSLTEGLRAEQGGSLTRPAFGKGASPEWGSFYAELSRIELMNSRSVARIGK